MEDDESLAQITVYLRRLSSGDLDAESQLANAVYAQMRRLARRVVSNEAADFSIQATALLNEALLELLRYRPVEWQDRAHFFRAASQLLRRRCIDHIRAQRAEKRPPRKLRVDLTDLPVPSPDRFEEILLVHTELEHLARKDKSLAELVEMVYFGGVSIEAVAEMRGVSDRTIKRHLDFARRCMKARLKKNCPVLSANSAK